MTEHRLHDLLADVVEDVPAPDLAGRAWERSDETRKRRRAALVGVAGLTATAIVAGAIWFNGDGTSTTPDPAATPTAPMASSDTTPGHPPGARLAGAPVWAAPLKSEEGELPQLPELESGLPAAIDLARPAADIESSPPSNALAAFEVGDASTEQFREILLLGAGGELRRLDVGGLDRTYVDPPGNRMSILTDESLSPDGTRLFLRQSDALMIYDLTDNSWQEIPTRGRSEESPRWTPDGSAIVVQDIAMTVPGNELTDPGAEPRTPADSRFPIESWWGPARSFGGTAAQAGFLSGVLPVTLGSSAIEVVQVIAVEGDRTALLAFPEGISREDSRWIGCCAVVSWLDDTAVAFESRGDPYTILAGDVETGQFWKVTTIEPAAGTYFFASYANLMH